MILSWLGLILGIGSILLGNFIEGGHIDSLIQPTAAMIVFGGTMGCTFLAATQKEFIMCLKMTPKAFFKGKPKFDALVKELLELSAVARREGVLALDGKLRAIKNQFLKSNLRHIVDGYDPTVLKEMMEESIHHEEEEKNAAVKLWETAGGFAPTIGILGAVLGLIHVMANLSDSSKLGAGIAVAFVATVYGVGSANLIFLPLGNKLKKMVKDEITELKLIYTALLGLQGGLNPRIIEDQMANVMGEHTVESKEGGGEMKKAA